MGNIVTNLHDMNKMLMGQMERLEYDGAGLADIINSLVKEDRQYFMLLSNEKRDYTVINILENKETGLSSAVFELIESRGLLKSFEMKGDNDAIEFWINDTFYALFPYDLGVIEC